MQSLWRRSRHPARPIRLVSSQRNLTESCSTPPVFGLYISYILIFLRVILAWGLFVSPYSVSDPSAFRFLTHTCLFHAICMNGFSPFFPNSYTEVALSLHFLSEFCLYPFFFLFSTVLGTCWRSLPLLCCMVAVHIPLSDFSAL